MNATLQKSLETAESILPQEGQDKLAFVVKAFAANYQQSAQDHFSEAELIELEQIDQEPFKEADNGKVNALFPSMVYKLAYSNRALASLTKNVLANSLPVFPILGRPYQGEIYTFR